MPTASNLTRPTMNYTNPDAKNTLLLDLITIIIASSVKHPPNGFRYRSSRGFQFKAKFIFPYLPIPHAWYFQNHSLHQRPVAVLP